MIKKSLLFLVTFITCFTLFAQSPQSIKYQAIARENAGDILANQNVSFRISILAESIGGDAVYIEIHDTGTNQFGLVTLEIGNGTATLGDLIQIISI